MPLKLIRRHGGKYWYIRGTVRGVTVDESTRTADRKAADTIRARKEWELLQSSVFGRRAVATFLEAAVSYMEAGGERRYLGRLIDHFGTTSLAKIDQLAIDAVAQKLLPGRASSTVNRQIHTPISAVLKHAAKRGLCEHRPVERPDQPNGRVRWVTPAEADRLIICCSKHLRPLVTFLFYTGARLSEALYLDWRNVDLDRRQVQFLNTKNGGSRGVPLHDEVVAVLAKITSKEGVVFRRPDGQPYSEKKDRSGGQIKTGFRAACRRAGISDFSPHDCRHTWATWHYAANRDLIALMRLGGWKSERMVLRYTHINVEQLAESIAALPRRKSGSGASGAR